MPESQRLAELKRRVLMDPASIAFAALAEEYRRAGRCEDAITACQTGLRRHPAYLSAHLTLGRALTGAGRVGEARAAFQRVLGLEPWNPAAMRALAELNAPSGASTIAISGPADAALCLVARSKSADAGALESPLVPAARFPQHSFGMDVVLGGLEDFLLAITRARATSVVAAR
jgi:predicted Zn-dependent protease